MSGLEITKEEGEIILKLACSVVSEWGDLDGGRAAWRLVDRIRAAFPELKPIRPEDM